MKNVTEISEISRSNLINETIENIIYRESQSQVKAIVTHCVHLNLINHCKLHIFIFDTTMTLYVHLVPVISDFQTSNSLFALFFLNFSTSNPRFYSKLFAMNKFYHSNFR